MTTTTVSIGQVKRDISELVNRVAYGKERVVLTSRGKPKAVLISIEDFEQISKIEKSLQQEQWQAWFAKADQLAEEILARRDGVPIDADAALEASRADLEARNDFLFEQR
jgi:prevent-host-death family protein